MSQNDFSFSLPFHLRLPDGEYEIRIANDVIVKLALATKIPTQYDDRMGIRGLTPDDIKDASIVHVMSFEDPLPEGRTRTFSVPPDEIWKLKESGQISYYVGKFDRENHSFEHPVLINSELVHDRLGRFRYTNVTMYYQGEHNNPLRMAADAINKLIDHYRLFSGDFWISRITPDDIQVYYSKKGTQRGYKPTVKFQRDVGPDTLKSIRKFIGSEVVIPAYFIIRLDAKNALELEDYRLAIILSIMSVESLVKTFLSKYFRLEFSSSEKCLKHLLDDVGLYRLVMEFLKFIIPESELTDELLKKFVRVDERRNEIIHSDFAATVGHARESLEVNADFRAIMLKRL